MTARNSHPADPSLVANKQVTIYIDPELRLAYKMKAAKTGRSVSDLVSTAMLAHLDPPHSETSVAPQSVGDLSPPADVALLDGPVVAALGEMASAIRELREQIGGASPAEAPETLQLRHDPGVEEAARRVVEFLDTKGVKGIQGTPFQEAMKATGSTSNEIKVATAALQRMDVIDRLKRGWVLVRHLKERPSEAKGETDGKRS